MEALLGRWRSLSTPAKRRVVIVTAVGGLLALYGLTKSESDAGKARGSPDARYVRAGGVLCQNMGYAVMHARAQNINGYRLVDGCQRIGGNIEVEILDRELSDGGEVLKVGNSGGTAWVVATDLR